MKRLVRTSLFIILCALVFVAPMPAMSQDSNDERDSPLDWRGDNDGALEGEISVTQLIATVVENTDGVFLYAPRQLKNRTVHVAGRLEQPETDLEWLHLLGDLLWPIGYTYIHASEKEATYRILPIQEAGAAAAAVARTPEELPEDVYFGGLVLHLERADVNGMQRALLNISTRPGGIVQPIPGTDALFIQDRRLTLKSMHHLAQLIDQPPAPPQDGEDSDDE